MGRAFENTYHSMPFAGASGLLQATFPGIVCILDGDRSGAVEVRGPPRPASRRGLGDDRGVHRDRRGGGLSNTLFSNYARDKGWGMGARVGAIPSAIGGRTIGLSHTCCVFPLNEENLSRWRRWMRHIRRDQAIWVLASILGAVIATLCVAASIAVGLSAILTGSRTRPSDRGSNARFGPVEDRRNNRRLATFTCTLCVVQIRFSRFGGCLSPTAPTDPPRDQEKPKTKSDTPSQDTPSQQV